ncbi:MAG: hypothetical protein AB1798_11025, partial [Spirochaetota bacterium]
MKTREGLIKFLRLSGFLLIAGLLVEGITLIWSHPVAFLIFISAGGLLLGAGILLYLYAIVS